MALTPEGMRAVQGIGPEQPSDFGTAFTDNRAGDERRRADSVLQMDLNRINDNFPTAPTVMARFAAICSLQAQLKQATSVDEREILVRTIAAANQAVYTDSDPLSIACAIQVQDTLNAYETDRANANDRDQLSMLADASGILIRTAVTGHAKRYS